MGSTVVALVVNRKAEEMKFNLVIAQPASSAVG